MDQNINDLFSPNHTRAYMSGHGALLILKQTIVRQKWNLMFLLRVKKIT
jgi:hypothetical protein